MGAVTDEKKTLEDPAGGTTQRPFRELGPLLFRLLNAEDLMAPSARYVLARRAEVAIGRADAASADARGAALVMGLADPYASTRHARLDSPGGAWHLSDGGSTNGTWLNGERLAAGQREPLRDGDFFEVGHTAFLFRAQARGAPDTRDLSPAAGQEPDTLCPEWELELARLERLAPTVHTVLIEGESGAGKEVLAQRLHALSARKALVSVNCGALTEHLLEDELFGHVRGAFSGAQADRLGLIRTADGGTLLLDEVGDMPASLQVKLLRVLEEQKVRPVGGDREVPVDVRLVAATHRDLDDLVRQGKFRQDLRSRLGLLPFRVPALRERREDLGLLVRAILVKRSAEKVSLTPEALRLLLRYSWPLNVRELRTALLAAADDARAGEGQPVAIAPHHLPKAVREPQADAPAAPAASQRELSDEDRALRDRVVELLKRLDGNVSAVAREMGKGRTQVQRWIARFGIDLK